MADKKLDEGIARREKTKNRLNSEGITFCESLPLINKEKIYKSVDDQCKRAIASLLIIQLACSVYEGDRDPDNIDIITKYLKMLKAEKSLLPEEKLLLEGKLSHDKIPMITWTYEAYWSLIWCLGLIEDISDASKICDCETAITLVRECIEYDEFKSKCKPRSREEILEMLDLYYCYHWACVDKQVNEKTSIGSLNPEVVMERRRGLEWVISKEKDWFDISLDT